MNSRLALACIAASLASVPAHAIPLKYSSQPTDTEDLHKVGDALLGSDFFQDDRDLAMSDSVYVFIPFSKERARIARDSGEESGTALRSQQAFGGFGDGLAGADFARSTPSYQSAGVIPSVVASFPSRTLAPLQAPAPAVIHTPASPSRSSGVNSPSMRPVSLPVASSVVLVAPVAKPRKPTEDNDKSKGGVVGGSVSKGGSKPSPTSPAVGVVNNTQGKGKPAAAAKGNKPAKGSIGDIASNKPKKDTPVQTKPTPKPKGTDKPKDNDKPKDKPKPSAPIGGGNGPVVVPPAAPVQQAPIPVPDGGSTLLMFGAAAAIGGLMRRWQRRSASTR